MTRSFDPLDCQILQSEAPADLYNRLEGPYVTCRLSVTFDGARECSTPVYFDQGSPSGGHDSTKMMDQVLGDASLPGYT